MYKTDYDQEADIFCHNRTAAKKRKEEDKRSTRKHDVDGSSVEIVSDDYSEKVPVNRHPYSNANEDTTTHLQTKHIIIFHHHNLFLHFNI